MTDMPVFGILCCGKDVDALAESVKCCGYITKIMKDGGFALGGYHTAFVRHGNSEFEKLAEDKLRHLCRSCNIVFTVGSDGFSRDDIIPDITLKLCESEAVFFTSNLCGLHSIANYDKNSGFKKGKESFAPSRSRAGILGGCLVLNIRNDMGFISEVLPGLLPSVSFASLCMCGRNAEENKKINESLKTFCAFPAIKNTLGGKNFNITF